MTTDTETQPPIHAAIPDGEVDEIRKRHDWFGVISESDTIYSAKSYFIQAHKDRATLLARLTALEAENAALKAELAALHDVQNNFSALLAATDPAARPDILAALQQLERKAQTYRQRWMSCLTIEESERIQKERAALKAEVAEARAKAIEECAKVAENTLGWSMHGDKRATVISKSIRSLSTSQGEQER